jgi:hypothetical protein
LVSSWSQGAACCRQQKPRAPAAESALPSLRSGHVVGTTRFRRLREPRATTRATAAARAGPRRHDRQALLVEFEAPPEAAAPARLAHVARAGDPDLPF